MKYDVAEIEQLCLVYSGKYFGFVLAQLVAVQFECTVFAVQFDLFSGRKPLNSLVAGKP
jgi:hypothetical protein